MRLPFGKILKLTLVLASAAAAIIAASPIIPSTEELHPGKDETISFVDSYPGGDLIPYEKIARKKVEKVAKIAKKHTLYRSLKPLRFKSHKATYEYLLDRLPLAAEITKLMGQGDYTITYKGDGIFHGEDGKGMAGDFEVLYADDHKRVYYGEGECRCALVGTIKGKVLLVLLYKQVNENSSNLMENKLYAYMKVDNKFFSLVLKAFGPIIGGLVDKKLRKFIVSAKIVSEAIASDPEKVYKYIEKSESISELQKKEFVELFIKK